MKLGDRWISWDDLTPEQQEKAAESQITSVAYGFGTGDLHIGGVNIFPATHPMQAAADRVIAKVGKGTKAVEILLSRHYDVVKATAREWAQGMTFNSTKL